MIAFLDERFLDDRFSDRFLDDRLAERFLDDPFLWDFLGLEIWYNFNDANVSKYNKATVEQQIVTNDANILFSSDMDINECGDNLELNLGQRWKQILWMISSKSNVNGQNPEVNYTKW